MTKSEQVFLQYCDQRGYKALPIPTESNIRRTADFRVNAAGTSFVVEVEEITPNDEDRRVHKELKEGRTASSGDIVGRRARSHIRHASSQLKSHIPEGLPGVIVLYDNIVIDGVRQRFPYTDLESFQIDAAMYGFIQVNLLANQQGIVGNKPDTAGGGRTTTHSEKLHVSAVCVLYDAPSLRMITYHNYFATLPLPLGVFSGNEDIHLKKPSNPVICPSEWVRA